MQIFNSPYGIHINSGFSRPGFRWYVTKHLQGAS